jgi:hypothetical protein
VAADGPAAQTVAVPASGNLQEALNRAQPGDTILLGRGATYLGDFTLPAIGTGDRPINRAHGRRRGRSRPCGINEIPHRYLAAESGGAGGECRHVKPGRDSPASISTEEKV